MKMLVTTRLGHEGLVADELRYNGFEGVKAENGRVFFEGDERALAKANIVCACGERVLLVIGEGEAKSFDELFEFTKALPWEDYLSSTDAFPVKGWSLNSTLSSVPDCQSIVKKAVVERLKNVYSLNWFEETGPVHQIQFSLLKDKLTLMLDTSGWPLYKRGYRAESNDAPMRETLAAAICNLAWVHADSIVVDPMCGSGTLAIEAARHAKNIAPGLYRPFAAEKWGNAYVKAFKEERAAARERIKKDIVFHAICSDIDPKCVELTLENAKKAHVEELIEASQMDVRRFKLDELKLDTTIHSRTLVLCNPPYGERLEDQKTARELYKTLGVVFPPARDVSYAIISPDEEFENCFGRKAYKRYKLYNGMLRCQLHLYLPTRK